jgi:branched-chain amino acid aminotransferase
MLHPVTDLPAVEHGPVWRDGVLIPHADATCHVLSHMAARGSQVFDVLRVVATAEGPAAVGLRPHVSRFLNSMELMGMASDTNLGTLERAVAETVLAGAEAAGSQGSGFYTVKLVAAWTEPGDGVMPASLTPSLYVLALPVASLADTAVLGQPVKLRSSEMPKMPPSVLPPSLKVAASYTPGLREQMRVRAEGYDYPVFRTADGDLAESTTLSILVIRGGRILAPPLDSVLDGISRRTVLDAAQYLSIPVDVRGVYWDEVEQADELILASTNRTVTPVELLDDRTLVAPGPVTEQLGAVVADIYRGEHPEVSTPLSTGATSAARVHAECCLPSVSERSNRTELFASPWSEGAAVSTVRTIRSRLDLANGPTLARRVTIHASGLSVRSTESTTSSQ